MPAITRTPLVLFGNCTALGPAGRTASNNMQLEALALAIDSFYRDAATHRQMYFLATCNGESVRHSENEWCLQRELSYDHLPS